LIGVGLRVSRTVETVENLTQSRKDAKVELGEDRNLQKITKTDLSGIIDMRVYFSWLSVILVATSAVAASNETGGPEPDQIYQTAFKEFKSSGVRLPTSAHGSSFDPTVKGSSSVSRRYHPAPKEALGRIEGQQYSRGLRFFQEIIKRPSLIV
jgi:hypothetical protein